MSRSFPWAALLLSFVVLLLGCASEPGPLWADPGVIHLDPERVEVDVEIHNISGTPRPIDKFALTGEDWGSLRFVDESHPRTVPPHASVIIRLAVSRASFRTEPGVYRSGRASLRFASNRHEFEVPIEFVGTAQPQPSAPPLWLAIVALTLIGLAATLTEPGLLTRLASPSVAGTRERLGVAGTRERLGVAGALAASLLVIASIPFGSGLCRQRASARVGPAELAQCREGLGGFELSLLPADPGVWWWLIALAVAAGLLAVVRFRRGASEAEIALGLVRMLGFAVVLASLSIGLAPTSASPVDLVLAQLRSVELGRLGIPAWGIVAQPIACAVTVALAVSVARARDAEPMHAAIERIERLVWAALITTVFLAGWTIPGLSDRPVPPLPHAAMLTAELAGFAIKIALVDLALRQLGRLLDRRQVTAAQLLRAHARWTFALALANLVAVALWRVY